MPNRPDEHGDVRHGAFPSDAEWHQIGSSLGWSPQELRVVTLLVRGLSCKRAAFVERLAQSTVRTYRSRAMAKARAATVPGLIWAIVGERDDVRRSLVDTK